MKKMVNYQLEALTITSFGYQLIKAYHNGEITKNDAVARMKAEFSRLPGGSYRFSPRGKLIKLTK